MDKLQPVATPGIFLRASNFFLVRLLVLALALAVTAVVSTIATRVLVPDAPSPLHQWVLLKNLLLPVLLLFVYAHAVPWLERRRASEVAPGPGVRLFPLGLVAGLTLIGGYVLILWISGAAHLSKGIASGEPLGLANEFLVPFLTSVGEELLFRAVLFRISEEMFGTAAAILISATLFGLSHAGNPGASPAALGALTLGMGVLLALAFAATRNLWFPIGLHMGWNMAEGFVYGLPNSGMTDPLQLARTSIAGSSALTGGTFGPEGSVVLLGICILASASLLCITLQTRRWTDLRCRLRTPRPPGE